MRSIRALPTDVQMSILSFHNHGSWHTVCRLVCRDWAQCLLKPSPDYLFAPYETVLYLRDGKLLSWLKMNGVPWSIRALEASAYLGQIIATHIQM